MGENDSQVVGDRHVHIAILKMDNQQGPIVQYMELCSMLCGSLDGSRVWGRMDMGICMAESLHCSSETIIRLFVNQLSLFSCPVVPTLCDPRDCSTPGLPILHHLQEFAQVCIHQLYHNKSFYFLFLFFFLIKVFKKRESLGDQFRPSWMTSLLINSSQ